jgi:hypothetical protein
MAQLHFAMASQLVAARRHVNDHRIGPLGSFAFSQTTTHGCPAAVA